MIWNLIRSNPDLVTAIITAALGLFGGARWRKAVTASTAEQVDRWANVTAAGVVLGIKAGVFHDHEAAMTDAMKRFYALANAAGVKLVPQHEAQAMATIHRALVAAGQDKLVDEAAKLHAVASVAAERLAALPWPRARQ